MADDTALPIEDDELETFTVDEGVVESGEYDEVLPYGTTWKFDFAAGDIYLNDRGQTTLVSDIDTVNEWIFHTLSVVRFESPIYGGDIGTDIDSLLGASILDEYTRSRIEQEITEAIAVHDRISEVHLVRTFPLGRDLFVYVQYLTDEGETTDVVVNLA